MPDNLLGVIVEVNRRSARVAGDDGRDYVCQYSPVIDLSAFSNFAVGDRVNFIAAGTQQEAMITGVLPRRGKISRPGPFERRSEELVLAANADAVLVVASARQPDFNPRLVDRYLALAEHFGLAAMICLNKSDLSETAAAPPELDYLRGLDYPVFLCSAQTGLGLAELEAAMRGLLVLLSGPSGVGKSSLIRALVPGANPLVGDLRKGEGKGRHTTTASHLYRTPSGAGLIDSPGIRELGFLGVSRKQLSALWRDIGELAQRCRFRDCVHRKEPECAVIAAAADGVLPGFRYQSYLRILESLPD